MVEDNLFLATEGYPSPVSGNLLAKCSAEFDSVSAESSPLSSCYAKIEKCNENYVVMLIDYARDMGWEKTNLYDSPASLSFSEGEAEFEVSSPAFLSYRYDLSLGHFESAIIGATNNRSSLLDSGASDVCRRLAFLAEVCGIKVGFISRDSDDVTVSDSSMLLPILRHYWGNNAEFRKLKFYKHPDVNNEMEEVSQGAVSEYVVKQAEAVRRGSDDFKNVFVTAPTGAGKSILFQIPALYLAEKYNIATIVVEPLKALMVDQVRNLQDRGVENVVAINSDIPYSERLASYERIQNGEASLIYLSPELLLESSLDSILNGRDLGLVVVDEAHTVTSWGKDFRPDYWYLGPFLSKLRKGGRRFPIFCLTATAVYGGRDDVANQTIKDLELGDCKLFLGNPRRNDIDFDIQWHNKAGFSGPIETIKADLVKKWIVGSVGNNKHAIVYCPYKSQVENIVDACGELSPKVLGYHGAYDKDYKQKASNYFAAGRCRVLVSTKAYGMGIDIDDIDAVYHYAPTGNLADYIQEIGRGARKRGLKATASIDFFPQDVRYAETLYALSKFAQWQLRGMMAKLYEIYSTMPADGRSQNFLVSPNTFSYLFANEKDEDRKINRVKSALMMISRDLEEKYNFPVLIVRPKISYTKQFVCIEADAEKAFVGKYGRYLKVISKAHVRNEYHAGQNPVRVSDIGSIYELDAGEMWSNEFASFTFADFKRRLLCGEICSIDGRPALSNRLVLDVVYTKDYESAVTQLGLFVDVLKDVFLSLVRDGDFSEKDFEGKLKDKLEKEGLSTDVRASALLNVFVRPVDSSGRIGLNVGFKCVKRMDRTQRSHGRYGESAYNVLKKELRPCMNSLKQSIRAMRPADGCRQCRRYLNSRVLGQSYALAEVLQILGLASYVVKGGDNPEIFIRLNDPIKIKSLSMDSRYSNGVLKELNERHEYSSKVLKGFFKTEMNRQDRWDLIEEYFLGNDDYVAQKLGIDANVVNQGESPAPKVRHATSNTRKGSDVLIKNEGIHPGATRLFKIWNELAIEFKTDNERRDIAKLKDATRGGSFGVPHIKPVLIIEDNSVELHPVLAWPDKHVALFSASQEDEYALSQPTNWDCFILGHGEKANGLPDRIRSSREDCE